MAVRGLFDQAAAETRCNLLSPGATLAYLESTDDRSLADSALRMAGVTSGWVGATASSASSTRTSFSWTSSSHTAYIAVASSWDAGEPNGDGTCVSHGGRLQDQPCSASLPAAVCRLSEGGDGRTPTELLGL